MFNVLNMKRLIYIITILLGWAGSAWGQSFVAGSVETSQCVGDITGTIEVAVDLSNVAVGNTVQIQLVLTTNLSLPSASTIVTEYVTKSGPEHNIEYLGPYTVNVGNNYRYWLRFGTDNNTAIGPYPFFPDNPGDRILKFDSNDTEPTCPGVGNITISVDGGRPNYTYTLIDDDSKEYLEAEKIYNFEFKNIPRDKSYDVYVKDSRGCEIGPQTISFDPYLDLSVDIDPVNIQLSCNDVVNDGEVRIKISEGTPGVMFSDYEFELWFDDNWNGFYPFDISDGTRTLDGLEPGDYYIIAYDAKCKDGFKSEFTILDRANVQIKNTAAPNTEIKVKCKGETVNIPVDAEGGLAPYTYSVDKISWSSPLNLTAGEYTVWAMDKNGCISNNSLEFTVTEPAVALDATIDVEKTSCTNDGKITVTGKGGWFANANEYDFKLEGDKTVGYPGTSEFSDLAEGTYDVTVKDAQGCEITKTGISVPVANSITINSITQDPLTATCSNQNGQITLTVGASGETGWNLAYYYKLVSESSWTGPQIDDGEFTGLSAGEYEISVKYRRNNVIIDCSEETDVYEIVVPEPIEIVFASSTPVLCNNETNGTITVKASGGYQVADSKYMFKLTETSPAGTARNTTTWYDSNALTDLGYTLKNVGPDTTFTITVKRVFSTDGGLTFTEDACPETVLPTVSVGPLDNPDKITITEDLNAHKNIDCPDDLPTGKFEVTASGGTGTLKYSLLIYDYITDDNDTYLTVAGKQDQPNGLFSSLDSAMYKVEVTDDKGCSETSEVIKITQPKPITIDFISDKDVPCSNVPANIKLDIDADDNASFVYQVFETGSLIPFIDWTDYDKTNGFEISAENEPKSYKVYVTYKDLKDLCSYSAESNEFEVKIADVSIEFIGTSPYDYDSNTAVTSKPGCVDWSNGRIVFTSSIVDPNVSYELYYNQEEPDNYDLYDRTFTFNLSTLTFSGLRQGYYQIHSSVTYGENVCIYPDKEIDLHIVPFSVQASSISSAPCSVSSKDGRVEFDVIGGTKPYIDYLLGLKEDLSWTTWSTDPSNSSSINPNSTGVFEDLGKGYYFVQIKDKNSCTSDWMPLPDGIQLEPPPELSVAVKDDDINHILCAGDLGSATVTVSDGRPDYDIQWYYSEDENEPRSWTPLGSLVTNEYESPALSKRWYYVEVTDECGTVRTSEPFEIEDRSLKITKVNSGWIECEVDEIPQGGFVTITTSGGIPFDISNAGSKYQYTVKRNLDDILLGAPQNYVVYNNDNPESEIYTIYGLNQDLQGEYTITVNDANLNGCSDDWTDIIEFGELDVVFSATATNPKCFGSDGEFEVEINGSSNYAMRITRKIDDDFHDVTFRVLNVSDDEIAPTAIIAGQYKVMVSMNDIDEYAEGEYKVEIMSEGSPCPPMEQIYKISNPGTFKPRLGLKGPAFNSSNFDIDNVIHLEKDVCSPFNGYPIYFGYGSLGGVVVDQSYLEKVNFDGTIEKIARSNVELTLITNATINITKTEADEPAGMYRYVIEYLSGCREESNFVIINKYLPLDAKLVSTEPQYCEGTGAINIEVIEGGKEGQTNNVYGFEVFDRNNNPVEIDDALFTGGVGSIFKITGDGLISGNYSAIMFLEQDVCSISPFPIDDIIIGNDTNIKFDEDEWFTIDMEPTCFNSSDGNITIQAPVSGVFDYKFTFPDGSEETGILDYDGTEASNYKVFANLKIGIYNLFIFDRESQCENNVDIELGADLPTVEIISDYVYNPDCGNNPPKGYIEFEVKYTANASSLGFDDFVTSIKCIIDGDEMNGDKLEMDTDDDPINNVYRRLFIVYPDNLSDMSVMSILVEIDGCDNLEEIDNPITIPEVMELTINDDFPANWDCSAGNTEKPVTFTVKGGEPDYSLLITKTDDATVIDTDDVVFNYDAGKDAYIAVVEIPEGEYELFIKDKLGCISPMTPLPLKVILPNLPSEEELIDMYSDISYAVCKSEESPTGSILINLDTEIYSFTWESDNDFNLEADNEISGLTAGEYKVTITEKLGVCKTPLIASYTIEFEYNIEIKNVVLNYENGTVEFELMLSDESLIPGDITVSSENFDTVENVEDIFDENDLRIGLKYRVLLNSGGISAIKAEIISNGCYDEIDPCPSELTELANDLLDDLPEDWDCARTDRDITFSIEGNDADNYQIAVFNDDDIEYNDFVSGSYTKNLETELEYNVRVKDKNTGCLVYSNGEPLVIILPEPVVIDDLEVTPPLCENATDGKIVLSDYDALYNFLWSEDNPTYDERYNAYHTQHEIQEGIYTVTVSHKNGFPCSTPFEIEITYIHDIKPKIIGNGQGDGLNEYCPGAPIELTGEIIINGYDIYEDDEKTDIRWRNGDMDETISEGSFSNPLTFDSPETAIKNVVLRVNYWPEGNLTGKTGSAPCIVERTFEVVQLEQPDLGKLYENDNGEEVLYISDLAESFEWNLDFTPDWFDYEYEWIVSTNIQGLPQYPDKPPFPLMLTPPAKEYTLTLFVKGDDEGCTAKYELPVRPAIMLEIPNGFTPNGDGWNDVWKFKNIEQYTDIFNIQVQVFNRAGMLMFEHKTYNDGVAWNGQYKQNDVPLNTYWYIVKIVPKSGTRGITRELKGTVTITR